MITKDYSRHKPLLAERPGVYRKVWGMKHKDGYVLETPIGPLHIRVFDNWIACRFENVPLATISPGAGATAFRKMELALLQ